VQKIYITIGLLLCMQSGYANAVTLQQAMNKATEQHPSLLISKAYIEAAEGKLSEQLSYAYNPELSIEPQYRQLNGGGRSNDYYISLSQGIELAGKQGYRSASADASSQVVKLSSEIQRQKIMIDVATALVDIYFSGRELQWRNQQAVTLMQLNKAIARQLQVGEANQLDMNLSKSSLKQMIHAEAQAKMQHTMNIYRYFLAVGKHGDMDTIQAELPTLPLNWKPASEPVQMALNSRIEIAVQRQRLIQYSADVDLALM